MREGEGEIEGREEAREGGERKEEVERGGVREYLCGWRSERDGLERIIDGEGVEKEREGGG